MATKKQNFEQSNESASAAAKTPPRKQSGNEPFTAPGQTTPANQGKSFNQVATGMPAKGAADQGATRQEATRQNTGGDQDLLQHAKQATGEIVNQVQQQAGSQIARQKDNAASDLTQVVHAVRRFGESLTGQEQGGPIARYAAEYGDKAANSLERFSTYIREQDPKQLLNDVQNFGRRRPVLLLGGAFLLGLAGARLIKSSMSMESQHSFQPNVPARKPPTSRNAL